MLNFQKLKGMKKIVILFSVAMLALNGFAQEEKAISQNGFWDNWFLQLQGGATFTVAGDQTLDLKDKGGKVGDITTPYVGFAVGKYFTPAVGARLNLGGWSIKNFNEKTNFNGEVLKSNYLQLSFDAMFNLMNIFGEYKTERIFDISLLTGVGYVRNLGFANEDIYGKPGTKNFVVPRVGAQFMFHVTKRFDIYAETNFNMINQHILKASRKEPAYLNAMVGLSFNLGRTGWKTGEFSDPAMIQSLNDKINQQRGQISEQESEIASLSNDLRDSEANNKMLQDELEKAKKSAKDLSEVKIVVTYEIGQVHVSKGQLVEIYNVAQLLDKYPEMKVHVTSYADAQTGSEERNQYLSEERANIVKRMFVENYEIAEDRIVTKAYGASEQVYGENDWNRVTIIELK